MENKTFKIMKLGDGKSPHILQNTDDEKEVIKLCSCGCTENPEGFCDTSHLEIKEKHDGCSCGHCH